MAGRQPLCAQLCRRVLDAVSYAPAEAAGTRAEPAPEPAGVRGGNAAAASGLKLGLAINPAFGFITLMPNKYIAKFERHENAVKLADIQKRALEAHEGFNRGNDGNWIVPVYDNSGEVVGRMEIYFRGKSKRGQAFLAPDPEGQQIAQSIVVQFNRP